MGPTKLAVSLGLCSVLLTVFMGATSQVIHIQRRLITLRLFGCGCATLVMPLLLFSSTCDYLLTQNTTHLMSQLPHLFTVDFLIFTVNSSSMLKYVVFTDSSLTTITNSRRQPRRTANSQATPNVPIALPAKTKQRKPSVTVEDIYLNRLWRSQMPKEKAMESILESPTSQQHSGKPTKRLRCLKFDDAPNRTKLRQRRQKAVKNGWKPLTKKQNAFLDSQIACKLAEIDSALM